MSHSERKLQDQDYIRLHRFYYEALNTYGSHSPHTVHWSDSANQEVRFSILQHVGIQDGAKILDVGCGLGDFYEYLKKEHLIVDYTGIDIMPEFIDIAKERFPDQRFIAKNILEFDERYEQFDYVIASGALSFKVENNQEYYFNMIKKMYSLATQALAFNMLNSGTHVDDDTYAAYDPDVVYDFCKTFCNRVEIIVDYLPQDFTVYLYKKV